MLQQEIAGDYVLATGTEHSVRDFAEFSFKEVGRVLEWKGSGINEIGVDAKYFRPTEVEYLLGDPSKAKRCLGWEHKTSSADMVREMVASDLELVQRERRVNIE